MFAGLRTVVVDEIHAFAGTKRGDLLALGLARLAPLAPRLPARRPVAPRSPIPDADRAGSLRYGARAASTIIRGRRGAEPIAHPHARRRACPGAGTWRCMRRRRSMRRSAAQDHAGLLQHPRPGRAGLPGAVAAQRRRPCRSASTTAPSRSSSAARSRRRWRAAGCAPWSRPRRSTSASTGATSTWSSRSARPRALSRLLQRIGRANHRLDEPSRALLVPANRFEVLECRAALEASRRTSSTETRRGPDGLDVLAQHILAWPARRRSMPDELYAEVTTRRALRRAAARRSSTTCSRFVARRRLCARRPMTAAKRLRREARRRLARPPTGASSRQHRMNVGTIVEAPMLKVRLARRPQVWARSRSGSSTASRPATPSSSPAGCCASRASARHRRSWSRVDERRGPRSHLCRRADAADHPPRRPRARASSPTAASWRALARRRAANGCGCSAGARCCREPDELLVETFPRGNAAFLVAYCFEGRNAHQTLGMLLTRRMERAGLKPLGFVATDYVLAVWGLARRPHEHRGAVRPGHARRRARGMDGRVLHAASAPSATSR